jgi:hypothetical protein
MHSENFPKKPSFFFREVFPKKKGWFLKKKDGYNFVSQDGIAAFLLQFN